jgi:hypothetical protein
VEHVVFYTGRDGTSQFRRTPNLEEAVRTVEALRNSESVEDSAVYALTPVPLTVKAVYVVELPGAGASAPAPAAAPLSELTVPPVEADPVPAAPAAEVAAEPVVEAPAAVVAPAPEVPEAPVETSTEAPAEPVAEEPAGEPVLAEASANGSGARSLGFFSR